jgi:hypothetical protein
VPNGQTEPAPIPAQTATPPKRQYLKHPTPQEIFEQIDSAAPFARDKICQTFIKVPVSWDLTFKGTGGSDRIRLRDKEVYQTVYAPVAFPKDNFLLQTREGAMIHVEGVIGKCGRFDIELEEVDLSLGDDQQKK